MTSLSRWAARCALASVVLAGCGQAGSKPTTAGETDAGSDAPGGSTAADRGGAAARDEAGGSGALASDVAADGGAAGDETTADGGAGDVGGASLAGETGTSGEAGTTESPCGGDECPAWTQVAGSLPPSYVYAIATAPGIAGTVYAGNYSGGGVFKTTNAGESWSSVSAGLEDGAVHVLAVDPFDTERVLVGNQTGLYLSVDAGAKWSRLEVADAYPDAQIITFDPHVRDRIYVVVSSDAAGPITSVAHVSQDGGESWQPLLTLPKTRASSLSIDGSDPNHLFLGTYNQGMLESHDGGQSFQLVSSLPEYTYQIVSDASSSILCGVTASGLSRSSDGGKTWVIEGPPSQNTIALGADGVFFSAGTSGVYRSQGCSNWMEVDTARGYMAAVDAAGAVYVAAAGTGSGRQGVRRSADGSSPFVNVNSGLANGDVLGLALDASVPDGFFASVSYQELVHSTDGAASFASITGDIGHAGSTAFPDSLVYDGHTLFGYSSMIFGRLFQRKAGEAWTEALPKFENDHYMAFTALLPSADPESLDRVYLGTRSYEDPAIGLVTSTDGATITVQGQTGFNTQRLIRDPTHAARLWAIGTPAGKAFGSVEDTLYTSQDSGLTWSAQSLPLQGHYAALAAGPTPNGEALYVVAEAHGVMRSDDAGQSWQVVSKPPGAEQARITAFAVDPTDASTVYLASSPNWQVSSLGDRGLFKSHDGGATWKHADRGMVPGVVKSLLVSPNDPQVVYAGMASGGLYRSSSAGE